MKRRIMAALLAVMCILAGCAPANRSLQAYCTESQREFLDQRQEELPAELVFHYWAETAASYRTTDEEIISGILQALREATVESKSSVRSTDNRILEFVTVEGDTCNFGFDERKLIGADEECYVLSGDDELWKLIWEIREADPEYQELIR